MSRYARPGKEDELIGISPVGDRDLVAVVTEKSNALVCKANEINELAGPGRGVTVIKLAPDDRVIGFVSTTKKDVALQLETTKGKYEKSYDYYGTPTAEGVTEVSWSGGKLLDEHYDEFVLRAYLTADLKPETTLYVPIVQECEGGAVERWIEIPAAGKSADDYRFPAPGLKLTPKK